MNAPDTVTTIFDHRFFVIGAIFVIFYVLYHINREIDTICADIREHREMARNYAAVEQQDMWEIRLYHNQIRAELGMKPIPIRPPFVESESGLEQQKKILQESEQYQ